MHYAYDATVLTTHTASNHLEIPIKLAAGIIKHISIIFPPGCVRLVSCTIWNPAIQLLPTNPEAVYREDNYVVEADCYYPTWIYGNSFTILAWNTGTTRSHTLHVMLDVQGVDEPDFNSSMKTLNNVIDTLVSLIKGWF